MPHVASIAYTPKGVPRRPEDNYARLSADRATLVANRGIAGDVKARPGRRQLNVMLANAVAQLRADGLTTEPGALGEQLVLAGISPEAFRPGAKIQLGDQAVIELTMIRTPCDRFAHIHKVSEEWAADRIGYMARVLEGGDITVGSPAKVLNHADDLGSM
jgi:MOSC domain-containing protein YiiM